MKKTSITQTLCNGHLDMKKYWPLAVMLMVLTYGCGNESGNDLSFSIDATPIRTHAPGDIRFELIRDDGNPSDLCTGTWNFGDGVSLSGDYEASHRFREAGKYDVDVELNCSGKKGHASTQIEVYGTVDLSLAALDAKPLDVSTDGSISVSLQVSNGAGTALQVPTYIDIYLTPTASETAYLEAGAVRLYRHSLQSLAAVGTDGSVQKLELDVPMDATIRTGSYYISAVVNADHLIGESSYQNNVAYSTQNITVRNQTTDGADFVASRLQVSPAVTSTLTSATAQFDIINQGSTTAEVFQYEIWLGAKDNATDMEGAVKVHESTIDGGMSGVERSFKNVLISIAPAITEPGFYYFWLKLDTGNIIVERDETNNIVRSSAPVQITDTPVLDADITITKLTFAPSQTNPGGTFSTTLELFNQGAQPTGSFICSIFLSDDMSLDIDKDAIVGSINVDNLAPTTSSTFTRIMETSTGVKPGKYWVYAFCDSSGVVSEANEDNNIQRSEQQITITNASDVDLVFGAPQIETSGNLNDGAPLSMSIVMCNKGSSAAGPAYVSAMIINQCDGTESEFDRVLVSGMDAGKCQTVYFNQPMKCDFWCPNYSAYFLADSTLIVDEKNENNNKKDLSTPIIMSGDSCVCVGDTYEMNNATAYAKSVKKVDADLTLCKDDEDYFKLDIADGEHFEAVLKHDKNVAPLKMELLRGPDVAASFDGSDALYLSGIGLSNIDIAPVYLHVTGLTEGNANRYHLSLDVYGNSTGIDLAGSTLNIEGGKLNASDNKTVSLTVGNIGSVASKPTYIGYYISQTSELDDTAWKIARQNLDALAPGAIVTPTISLRLPADMAGGNYHLIAKLDDDDVNDDVKLSNNIVRTSAWPFERSCWDVLDPNEEFETARKITFNNGHFHYDNLAVCQNNRDIYEFDIEHGKMLDITAVAKESGDFDLVLYDQYRNEIASSRTGNLTEKIHRDLIVGNQKLYLEVFLLENIYNARESSYSLDIQISDAPSWNACNPEFEPNNFASASFDLLQAARSGKPAEICPSEDEDFYAIALNTGDRFQLSVDTQSSGLRAALYRGENLNFVSMLTNPQKQAFDYTATEDNIYYLRIYTNVSNATPMTYQLNWLGEDKDDISVSNLTVSSLAPYAGSSVVVDFDIRNQGAEKAAYNAEIAVSGIQKFTVAQIQGEVAAASTEHVRNRITVPTQLNGNATLTVFVSSDNDSNTENNSISQSLTISPACQNDTAEPNNNILRATPLETSANGAICPEDEDWFVINPSDKATVKLAFSYEKGDLSLFLFDENGIEIARSETASDSESIEVESSGKYYILVKSAVPGAANTYTITLEQ